MKYLISGIAIAILSGCSSIPSTPDTLAERETSYSYIPFDPLPVQTLMGASCSPEDVERKLKSIDKVVLRDIRDSFPDQTVRLAVAEFDSGGSLNFGPTTVGYEGGSYQVIIDYVNTDTATGSFLVKREVAGQIPERKWWGGKYIYPDYEKGKVVKLFERVPNTVVTNYMVLPNPNNSLFRAFQTFEGSSNKSDEEVDISSIKNAGYEVVNLPVYVGVGLRLTATIKVLKGEVNLSGLPQIAAEAKAGNLTGTLVVQTLGATGELVSSNLPLPSELDRTTTQDAILSLGAIKALLPDENMRITPRVIGIYNPVGGGQSFVNGVISALAADRLTWYQPCDYIYSRS